MTTKTGVECDENTTTKKIPERYVVKKSKIKDWIIEADDEDVLEMFTEFLKHRVALGNQFIQDKGGYITHQVAVGVCGDYHFTSSPQELEWPMLPMRAEDLVGKENVN